MSDELRRLRAQQEAQAAQLHRMQMQMQAQSARHEEPDEVYEEVYEEPQYQQVNPNDAMIQSIAQQAAQQAAYHVQQNIQANQDVENKVKTRMQRLVADYPAIQDEDSPLTVRARDAYTRITAENPTLDEATKYELAVREAASVLGARPLNAPVEDMAAADYLMPSGRNPAISQSRSQKSRLTQNVVKNAMAMGINVDPNSAEGKKNLAELNEYSARFNADQDESAFRYK
jgi:hypothetical protein